MRRSIDRGQARIGGGWGQTQATSIPIRTGGACRGRAGAPFEPKTVQGPVGRAFGTVTGRGKAMGEFQHYFDIILFAMVAGFLVLRLRSVLGRRTGNERRRDLFARRAAPASSDDVWQPR